MHAGFGPVRIDQTTGSLGVDLSNGRLDVWITGTSLPCVSLFRPVHFGDFVEDTVISSEYDWREREMFNRTVMFCPEDFMRDFRALRDQLEVRFTRQPLDADARQISRIDQQYRQEMDGFYRRWLVKAEAEIKPGGHFLMRHAWKKFNKEAKISIDL
jgi:hypothetical protein